MFCLSQFEIEFNEVPNGNERRQNPPDIGTFFPKNVPTERGYSVNFPLGSFFVKDDDEIMNGSFWQFSN